MKKLFFAAAMMLFTTAASAQTITNESVMKTYLDAVQTENADYAYNADIDTMPTLKTEFSPHSTSSASRRAIVERKPTPCSHRT